MFIENMNATAKEVVFWNNIQWITVTPEIRRVISDYYDVRAEEELLLAFSKKVSQKRGIECMMPCGNHLCDNEGTFATMGMCTKHYDMMMEEENIDTFRQMLEHKSAQLQKWNTTEMLLLREYRMLWSKPELRAINRDHRLQMLGGGQPLGSEARDFAENKAAKIIGHLKKHRINIEFSVEATNGRQRAKASYLSEEKANGDVVWTLKVNANPIPYAVIEREISEGKLHWAFRVSFDIPKKEDKKGKITREYIAMQDHILPMYTQKVAPAYENATDTKVLLTYLLNHDGDMVTDFSFTDHLPVDKANKRMNVLWQQLPMHTDYSNTVFLCPDEEMPAVRDEDTLYVRVYPNPDLLEDWDGELYMSNRLKKRMLDNIKNTVTRGDSRIYRKVEGHYTFNFRGLSRMSEEAHEKLSPYLKDKQKPAANPNGFFYLKGDVIVRADEEEAAVLKGADIATIAENIAVEMGLAEEFTGHFVMQVNPQHSGLLKSNPQFMAAMGRAIMMTPDAEGLTQYERSLAKKIGTATTRLVTGQAGGDDVDRGAAFTDSDIGRFICENLGNTLPSLWATRESIEWELTALDIAENKYEYWERFTWVSNAFLWSLRSQGTMDALYGPDNHDFNLSGNTIGLSKDYHSVIVGRDIVKMVMESLGGADKDDHVGVIFRKLTKDYTFKAGDHETHFKAGEVVAVLVRFPLGMRAHEGKVGAEFWVARFSDNDETQQVAAPYMDDAIEIDPDLLPRHVFELPTPQFNNPRPPTTQATLAQKFELSAELIGGYGRISIASSALLFLGMELERAGMTYDFTVPGSMEFYIDTYVQLRHPGDLRASTQHYDQMRADVMGIARTLGYIDPIINTRMGLDMDNLVAPTILSDAIGLHLKYEEAQAKALVTFREGYFDLFEELAMKHQPDYLNDTLLGSAYSARRAIPETNGTTWTARHELIAKRFADKAENVTTKRVKQAIVLQGMDIADLRQGRRHMLTVSASVFSPWFAPRVVNALTEKDVQSLNDLLDLSETYGQILSDMDEDEMTLLEREVRKAFIVLDEEV